jgi:dGTPase
MAPSREDRLYDLDKKEDGARSQRDTRSPFQHDRDRILYTSAFRRLGGVTQVVASAEGHVFHNRLTHTLEVAQIARRLAERLAESTEKEVLNGVGGLDADVAEAAALAHDLGHPPFGHIAEDELKDLAKNDGGFEGNPQSFRIVTNLSLRKREFGGLNLTRATLNAILKYPWHRADHGDRNRKWGYYETEKEAFDFARDLCPPGDETKSAEAEIMDWSDDVAYAVHDVEDFYRVGLIPLDRLAVDSLERARFFEKTFARWDAEKLNKDFETPKARKTLSDVFTQLMELIPEPVRELYTGTRRQRAALRSLTSALIGRYSDGIRLHVPEASNKRRVILSQDMQLELKMLKELTWTYVIRNPRLATQQHGQRKVIRDLFGYFFKAAKDAPGRTIFPVPYKEQLEQLEREYPRGDRKKARVRAVIDLIAGLTEQTALDMHRRLTGVSSGSITDMLLR